MLTSLTNLVSFIESIFGKGHLGADCKNFAVRCPFCSPTSMSKKKLVILLSTHVLHCWTCGFKAHTLAPLVRKFGTSEQFATYRDKYMPEEARKRFKDLNAVVEEKEKLELPKDFKLLTMANAIDPDVRSAWGYLTSRNVSVRDAWYYKLGLSNDHRWKRRIIMPSFDSSGDLNYYVGRTIDERDKRYKYDNPELDKLPIIFNEINVDWTSRLTLCEGPFDVMKCGENAVPLLGSDLNEQSRLFNQILVHNTPVALALDGDMWRKKTPRIAKKLMEYDVDVVIVDVREWGDPGKMTKQQFKQALEAARPMTWEGSFAERLAAASEVKLRLRPDVYKHENNRNTKMYSV